MPSAKGSGAGGAAYLLFLTHHLLSATKQSQLRAWAKDLSLVGLAKRGYPGVILLLAASTATSASSSGLKGALEGRGRAQLQDVEGEGESRERLEEVGRRIKRMQWASQDLRPVQALRSSTLARLQVILAERQGGEAGADQQVSAVGTAASTKAARRLPPLLFLDSMKEISALFQEADQLAPPGEGKGAKAGQTGKGSSSRPNQELWRDIWRREMRPR